jgi:hypothetical protein
LPQVIDLISDLLFSEPEPIILRKLARYNIALLQTKIKAKDFMLLRDLRVLLTSRKLFSNWLSAGIKYYLIKHGIIGGDITIRYGIRKFVLKPKEYSFIINAFYDGALKEVHNGSSGESLGRLCGVIDLVVTARGGILRMPDGVLLALESSKLGVIAET